MQPQRFRRDPYERGIRLRNPEHRPLGRSLSAAARHLGVEHATVARRVAGLEGRLGLKLIDRRGRRLVLTPDGERVAIVVERMTTDFQAIERLAVGARSAGPIRRSRCVCLEKRG